MSDQTLSTDEVQLELDALDVRVSKDLPATGRGRKKGKKPAPARGDVTAAGKTAAKIHGNGGAGQGIAKKTNSRNTVIRAMRRKPGHRPKKSSLGVAIARRAKSNSGKHGELYIPSDEICRAFSIVERDQRLSELFTFLLNIVVWCRFRAKREIAFIAKERKTHTDLVPACPSGPLRLVGSTGLEVRVVKGEEEEKGNWRAEREKLTPRPIDPPNSVHEHWMQNTAVRTELSGTSDYDLSFEGIDSMQSYWKWLNVSVAIPSCTSARRNSRDIPSFAPSLLDNADDICAIRLSGGEIERVTKTLQNSTLQHSTSPMLGFLRLNFPPAPCPSSWPLLAALFVCSHCRYAPCSLGVVQRNAKDRKPNGIYFGLY